VRKRGNIVILRTSSRESGFKAAAYADAAKRLGLTVRGYPDRRTVAVIPASDFRALDAAWMCLHHGIPGPEPAAVAIASSKSLTYAFLRSRGFELLPWLVPGEERDLKLSLKGPIILKPDSGSGSVSKAPWAYRVFDDLRDFRAYLNREELIGKFFEMQRAGGIHRHLAMRYVESSDVYSVAAVVGDRRPALFDVNATQTMADSKVIGRIIIGLRHRATASAFAMASALVEAGLRRSIIFLQCVARRGKLYPIDLNLRPGTLWSLAAVKLISTAYQELLSVILGYKNAAEMRWPAPYVGIARAPMPLRKGRYRVELAGSAVSLLDEIAYDPGKYYDIGHAWPTLAINCQRPEEFALRLPAAIASIKLTKLRAAKQSR